MERNFQDIMEHPHSACPTKRKQMEQQRADMQHKLPIVNAHDAVAKQHPQILSSGALCIGQAKNIFFLCVEDIFSLILGTSLYPFTHSHGNWSQISPKARKEKNYQKIFFTTFKALK